jgi:hypothetical protein
VSSRTGAGIYLRVPTAPDAELLMRVTAVSG